MDCDLSSTPDVTRLRGWSWFVAHVLLTAIVCSPHMRAAEPDQELWTREAVLPVLVEPLTKYKLGEPLVSPKHIRAATLSSDGRLILTASEKGSISLWDVDNLRELWTLDGCEKDIVSVSFSHDGQRILFSSYDRTARVWEARSGRELLVLRGHQSWVWRAVFSPDDQRIATASYDGSARVWDAQSGRLVATYAKHGKCAFHIVFSPDGRYVASAGHAWPRLAKWETETGRELAAIDEDRHGIVSIAFSPDGRRIVTTHDVNTAHVWDSETGKETAELTIRGMQSYVWGAFLPNGKRILTVSDDRFPSSGLTAPAKSNYLRLLDDRGNPVSAATFTPDGSQVVAGGSKITAFLWDAATGQKLSELKVYVPNSPEDIEWAKKEGLVLGRTSRCGAMVWDVATGQPLASLKGLESGLLTVSLSKDGQRMVIVGTDGEVSLWRSTKGKIDR
ncbi:MAG TPA: WD40 repeat domain-containing protein [Planctomycetota bacterium]|jgi:WD40 repeat protein